jgi:hypothetical protein
MKTLFKAALLTLTLAATPVIADTIPNDALDAIGARVDGMNKAFRNGGMPPALLIGYLPDQLLATVLSQEDVPRPALETAFLEASNMTFSTLSTSEFSLDLDAATWSVLEDGQRGYALIPTEVEMTSNGGRTFRSVSQTIAFEDAGSWFLLSANNSTAMQSLLKGFPEFTGVTFAPAAVTAVE